MRRRIRKPRGASTLSAPGEISLLPQPCTCPTVTRERGLALLVFGGLVWILISSSLVPIPLVQGWVMFVSVFCFVTTTLLLFLYVIGAHGSGTFWITLALSSELSTAAQGSPQQAVSGDQQPNKPPCTSCTCQAPTGISHHPGEFVSISGEGGQGPGDWPWLPSDAAYHCVASLFYFGASVLEAFATIQMQDGFRYKQYHENISAVVTWDN
ncbi:hypothetical protein CB1_000688001 [Camelus ferus]|nr:hypothetical protein CB1_000688001 [Camelus ferus]